MDLGAALAEEQTKAFRKSSAVKSLKEEPPARWGLHDPKEYFEEYGVLKQMPANGDLSTAFGDGPSGHNKPLITRDRVEILPGIGSFDKPVLQFQDDLVNDLNANLKVDLDDDLFTKTGIHTNFDRLRCPAGYFQNPMSYTTVDNAEYRKELGLSGGYTPRQNEIAKEFWHLIFSEARACPINVAKLSTGGMRRFSSSAQWKLDYANFLTQPAEFDRMLNCVGSKDWRTLANRYEMLFATYIQKRGQVDSPGKVRYAFDLEYALSGGLEGHAIPTDKKVILHGKEWKGFSAVRARVVHAGPWTINCFLQMVASTTMQSMFLRFPKTFHINTAEQIKSVVDGKYIFCSDVTEYDRSMSRDAIRVPHDVMREYWDERIVDASWRLFTAPYYAKPLMLNPTGDQRKGKWIKDPTDWSDEVFAGNRSGHALTSLIAKGNKVIESLFIIDRIYPVLGRISKFLLHDMPMALVNNGDDEIATATQATDMARFKSLRVDKTAGHYVVEAETGNGYSGMLLVKPGPELVYFPQARVHTSLEKMWVPERSIGGHHRKYWPIGMMDRIGNLTSTDIGREAWAITLSNYRKHLQPYHGDINEILTSAVARMDIRLDGLQAKDREVLADNGKIHHKYLPDEISDVVMDKISSKIPIERTVTILKNHYTGHVM